MTRARVALDLLEGNRLLPETVEQCAELCAALLRRAGVEPADCDWCGGKGFTWGPPGESPDCGKCDGTGWGKAWQVPCPERGD